MADPAKKNDSDLPRISSSSTDKSQSVVREHASNELFFAVVGHAGSGTTEVAKRLKDVLEAPNQKDGPFEVEIIKAREVILERAKSDGKQIPPDDRKNIENTIFLQDMGDEMREHDHAAVARALVSKIRKIRMEKQHSPVDDSKPVNPDGKRRAYILDSIKHPEEVNLLRRLYQSAFSLFGVVCEEEIRIKRITDKYSNAGTDAAKNFMDRDADDSLTHGQHVSDAFHLADVFLDNTQDQFVSGNPKNPNQLWNIPDQLERTVKLITHQELIRPTPDESAMYAANGAKLRSSCLSRQVGAAVVDSMGTVISTGTNEVPCAGGGVYHEGGLEETGRGDERCAFGLKGCSNTKEQNTIIDEIIDAIMPLATASIKEDLDKKLRDTRIMSLLEFSRAVHAEMDALLSAARRGITVIGTKLFVTTFPCHYCARHVVSAGIDEVQYIEPYPKSQALKLHYDSITIDLKEWEPPSKGGGKVLFRPYTGVSPRMYEKAFIKNRPLKNKKTGDCEIGDPDWGSAWDILKISYPDLEVMLSKPSEGSDEKT
jgi:deoxycytidylate deaminase